MMKTIKINIGFVILLGITVTAIIFLLPSYQVKKTPPVFENSLKIGDWVFRQGEQMDSLIIRQLGGGDFSHIGVVVSVYPNIKILHATTDDDPAYPNQVIESDFDDFIQPRLAKKFAIARPNFISDEQQAKIVLELESQLGKRFMLADRDHPHLYCTTIIAEAIKKFVPNFSVDWTYVTFPFVNGNYLFPSAFTNREDIIWIHYKS